MQNAFKHRTPIWTPTHDTLLVVIAALLLAIWPLPGTIALRNLLLLAGLLLGAAKCAQMEYRQFQVKSYWPVAVLIAFFPWLIWHLWAWSTLPDEQWYDLRGDWARAFCATITGLGLGLVLAQNRINDSCRAGLHDRLLLLGLSSTVVIYAIRYVYEVYRTGVLLHLNFFEQPYGGKTAIVTFGGLLLSALFVRLLDAMDGRRLRMVHWVYGAGILLVLASFYFANTKNGFIVFLTCSTLFAGALIRTQLKMRVHELKGLLIVLLIAGSMLAAFTAHWRSNPAWHNLIENVRLCADIENQSFWRDQSAFPVPTNSSGKTVDISTCQRVAWARAGLVLISEHPTGFGLINHSFGALAINRWESFAKPEGKRRGATHSGLIDFTLGFGIFGLLLILTPLLVAFQRSIHRKGFWLRYTRWAVPVLLLIYFITELCTGHFIELLFFLCATFSALCAAEHAAKSRPNAA